MLDGRMHDWSGGGVMKAGAQGTQSLTPCFCGAGEDLWRQVTCKTASVQGGGEAEWAEKEAHHCFLEPPRVHTIWPSIDIILPVTNLFIHSSRAPVFDVRHIMATHRRHLGGVATWSQPGTHVLSAFYALLLDFLFCVFSDPLQGCSMILRKSISRRRRGKR